MKQRKELCTDRIPHTIQKRGTIMAFYLVDYENVNIDGMLGVEQLAATDEVIVFYSEHADRLTFDLHQRINASDAQVSYVKVGSCKKNALDFQLVTYLGYLIAQHPGDIFYIISRDTGFQSVLKFWSEKQICVVQTDDLQQTAVQSTPDGSEDTLEQQVKQLFSDTNTAAIVLDCLRNSSSRQDLHNRLAAQLRHDGVGSIYQKVKQLL